MSFSFWFVSTLVIAAVGFTVMFILSLKDEKDPLYDHQETKAVADTGKTIEDYFREHGHDDHHH
jgi:hypothetical protein